MSGKQPTFVHVVYLAQLSAANIAIVWVECSDVTSGDACSNSMQA